MSLSYPDPELTDGVVRLRPWRIDDTDCVRRASADPAIVVGTTVPVVYTPEEGVAFIERQWRRLQEREGISLAITEEGVDRAVGLMFIARRPQPLVAGLGYWLVPEARGRGLARRAARLAGDWALGALGMARVEAWVLPDNEASLRVLAAAGFEREGLLRSFLGFDAERADAVVLSRVRDAGADPSTAAELPLSAAAAPPSEPRRNVELKARDPDRIRTLETCRRIGAVDGGVLWQRDTYFRVEHGGLKLREQDPGAPHLIQWDRPDEAGARESRYRIAEVGDVPALRAVLGAALGGRGVVEKTRHLFLWGSVRIHVDDVVGLGHFIEFEAVAPSSSDLAPERRLVAELRQLFAITDELLCAGGYARLMGMPQP